VQLDSPKLPAAMSGFVFASSALPASSLDRVCLGTCWRGPVLDASVSDIDRRISPSHHIQIVVVIGAALDLDRNCDCDRDCDCDCDCDFKLRTSAAAAAAARALLSLPAPLPNVLPGPPTFGCGFVVEGPSVLAIRGGTEAFALDCGGGAPTVRPAPWKLSSDWDPQQLPICALRWWRMSLR
jgi:hypothetical protein